MKRIWIKEKFLEARKYFPILDQILECDLKQLESDVGLQLQAERLFEVLIQLLIDVCTHIIAHNELEPPRTYAGCMKKLSEIGVLSLQNAKLASEMVKMRNLIVHQYANIQYLLLFEALKKLRKDFITIQEDILKWVQDQS